MKRNLIGKKATPYLLMLMIYSLVFPMHIFALPQGGQVVAGNATISQPDALNMNINQSTQKAAIDWNTFSIARPETVNVFQPNASAALLNRVVTANPSYIYGTINANGQVFLINPAGILVGPDGVINTAAFIGSTLDMANDDFLSGNYVFNQTLGSSLAAIVNQGTIRAADGGFVSLLAPGVDNQGTIMANLGKVYLAGAERVTLNFAGNDLIGFELDGAIKDQVLDAEGNALESTIENSGTIMADGGQVMLSAQTAFDAIKNVVNNEGEIRARSLVNKNGEIILAGGDAGTVVNAGLLDASGTDAGETGGTIKVLGNTVKILTAASLKASGHQGGGEITMTGVQVGQLGEVRADGIQGDGGSISLYAENTVALGSQSLTTANAGVNGDGGEIIVFSPDTALFRSGAEIQARGGLDAGDGGFIEVSGVRHVEIFGLADASAINGTAGTFLIDPTDITIVNADTATADIGDDSDGTFTANADANEILNSIIEGYLNAGTSVTLDTSDHSGGPYSGSGDILQNSDAAITVDQTAMSSNATLTLIAERDITLDGGITYTNDNATYAVGVDLQADRNITIQTNAINVDGTVLLKGGLGGGTGGTITLLADVIGSTVTASGGGSADTLVGPNVTNAWSITGANSGTLAYTVGSASTINFTTIENLTGGSGADAFTLSGTGNISGTISGGTAGIDTLTGNDIASTWAISAANAGTLTDANGGNAFTGIDALVGGTNTDAFTLGAGVSTFSGSIAGGTGANTLASTDTANTWSVTSANTGALNTTTTFSAIANLTGGSDTDSFTLSGTGNISGTISGGTAGIDTLTGNDIASTWAISAANAGTLTDANGGNAFTGIDTLVGGTNTDAFTLGAGVSTFSGSIAGGTGANTLASTDTANTWSVTAANTGALNTTTTFSAIANLTGGTAADAFTLSGGTLSGSIAGGGGVGVNTLTGDNLANTWGVTGNDSGTLTGVTGGYSDIDNLVGGSSTDAFNLSDAVTVTGSIEGSGGSDTLNLSAYTTARSVALTALGGTDGFNGTEASIASGFSNIDQITAPAAGGDSLAGADLANVWTITGAGDGNISSGGQIVNFTDFDNLSGGTAADAFTLSGGTLSGSIAGGGGAGVNTLTGDNLANTWTVTGLDAGAVTGVTGGFSDIDNLVGGTATDAFTLSGGTLSGSIAGGGGVGVNTLTGDNLANTWTVTGVDSGTVTGVTGGFSDIDNLVGGTATDAFTLSGGTLSGSIAGGGGVGVNTLTGDNLANTWGVTGVDTGTVTGVTGGFSDIDNLTGGTSTDSFTFGAAGSVSGQINGQGGTDVIVINDQGVGSSRTYTIGATTIDRIGIPMGYAGIETLTLNSGTANDTVNLAGAGVTDLTLDTGTGTDAVNLTGSFSVAGNVHITAENITNAGSNTLGANLLTLVDTTSVGTSSNPIGTNINTLTVTNGGNVYVNETGGISLTASGTSGMLSVNSGGAFALTGAIASNGGFHSSGTTFNSGGNAINTVNSDISLDHSGDMTIFDMNAGSGNISLTASNDSAIDGAGLLFADTLTVDAGTIGLSDSPTIAFLTLNMDMTATDGSGFTGKLKMDRVNYGDHPADGDYPPAAGDVLGDNNGPGIIEISDATTTYRYEPGSETPSAVRAAASSAASASITDTSLDEALDAAASGEAFMSKPILLNIDLAEEGGEEGDDDFLDDEEEEEL